MVVSDIHRMILTDIAICRQHYLLRGEKDEMKLSKEERELILRYHWLHQEPKDKLIETAEVFVNLGRSNTKNKQKEKNGE